MNKLRVLVTEWEYSNLRALAQLVGRQYHADPRPYGYRRRKGDGFKLDAWEVLAHVAWRLPHEDLFFARSRLRQRTWSLDVTVAKAWWVLISTAPPDLGERVSLSVDALQAFFAKLDQALENYRP